MNEFMKKGLLIVFSVVLTAVACNKDNFGTTPTLKIKSINGNLIPPGQNSALVVEFEFTDKEGDVSDTLYVKKIRINQKKVATIRDSFTLRVPDFPQNSKGDIKVTLDYNNYLISAINPPTSGNPPVADPDTLMIQFALKDRGNHISDTVQTGPIVVIR
jgi:hypothetical protein